MFSAVFTWNSLWLALAWVAYCALHSLLAATASKNWIARHAPALGRRYRLVYNLLASVLLIPLLVITERASDDWLWRWQGSWAWAAHAVTALVALGFLWSSRAYDMRAFLGLSAAGTPARFGLSPLHRFVRHPWYFLGLMWLWTRDMDSARLVAVLSVSGYLWLGSWLEEGRLERELGEIYREYRRRVPGLIPRPWRYLSRTEYEALQRTGATAFSANRPAPR